jgi:hypothetical protein
VTISAKESTLNPADLKLSIIEQKTIKKSKKYPNTQNKKPFQNKVVTTIAIQPQRRLSNVIELGMCFLIFIAN